jgi:hypothetical protein
MKAKELIARLEKMVAENGDINILIGNAESGDFDTVKDVKVVQPDKFNALISPGIELEVGLM